VDCHMPEKTYMQVDPRRDHSLRIPRPDLAQTMGAPDACTACHSDQSQQWAAARLKEWFGEPAGLHYGEVFRDARRRKPSAEPQLIALSQNPNEAAIVRGTALLLLAGFPSEASLGALKSAVESKQALIRLGVTRGALGLAPQQRVELLLPLLSDPLLAIRTEAARSLVGLPAGAIAAGARAKVEQAWKELERTELFYADRPDAWLRLALLELGRGDVNAAEAALEKSLQLDPRFTLALVNLADLRRSQNREEEAVVLLRRAISIDEENAEAWHALGLSLVRQNRTPEAVPLLRKAAHLRPENPRFFYVCAVALAETGKLKQSVSLLQEGLSHHPNDRTLLQSLMTYAKQAGDRALASEAAARLAGVGDLLDR
jgi:tetratricopeptide (TPR) repeat protein